MNKILVASVVAALVLGTYYLTYKLGSHSGADSVQERWDQQTKERNDKITQLEKEYAGLQALHAQRVQELTDELETSSANYAATLAQYQYDFAVRLQQSQTRAGIYQRQAQGSSAERDRLAEHAARLDESLEEGRQLVREFGETVRQRDRTIRSLGIMIQTDRQLFNAE